MIVIVSGPTDFNLETVAVNDNGVWLKRVVFEQDRRPKLFYVKCCQQNTFMLDLKYQLWGFGESIFGQLGERVETLKHPMNISQITKVQFDQISGGSDFIVAHALTRQLYVWGNVPTHLPRAEQVTFTLDRDKKLFQIKGLNLTKYFNQSFTETSSNFTSLHSTKRSSKILYFVETAAISAYNKYIYILTKDGVLYPFGTQIQCEQRFCGISCGPNHVLAWEENGNVWSWGDFADGKLGYMRFDEPEQKEPKIIADFKAKAIQCVCGSNYSIALDVKGDIYTWGKGPFKMDLSRAAMPSIIVKKKSPFIKVAAGSDHFGAINSSGQLYVWGSNKKGSIFNFPEEVLKPTLLPIEKRIIDFDMQAYNTVLILQVDAKHHLPLLNFEHFKSEQYKVISEEASLIQSYINKKTSIEFEKRKTEESKSKKSSSVPSTLPILFDQVQVQLMKLEQENQLYVPITHAKTARTTRVPSQENIELESVILSDNDQLKYEYIQLAREKDEEGLLLSILNDGIQKQEKIPMKMPQIRQINQFKHKFKIQKPVFHDKYDQFDKSIIQSTRNQILEFNSKRAKKLLEQKRQREQEFEKISQQSLISLQPLQSKAQLIQSIKEKAQQHLVKSQQVNQKKQEIVSQRINHFTEQLYEKSLDYRLKQRSIQRQKLERQWALKFLLTFLNEQALCQMFGDAPEQVRLKAAIKIQRFFRKHL